MLPDSVRGINQHQDGARPTPENESLKHLTIGNPETSGCLLGNVAFSNISITARSKLNLLSSENLDGTSRGIRLFIRHKSLHSLNLKSEALLIANNRIKVACGQPFRGFN